MENVKQFYPIRPSNTKLQSNSLQHIIHIPDDITRNIIDWILKGKMVKVATTLYSWWRQI